MMEKVVHQRGMFKIIHKFIKKQTYKQSLKTTYILNSWGNNGGVVTSSRVSLNR